MSAKLRALVGLFGVLSLLLCLAVWGAYSFYSSKYGLETSHYSISSPSSSSDNASEPFRIVQLTDSHNSIFGPSNSLLVAQVAKEEPDLILITGDMVNDKTGADTSVAVSLIEDLVKLAPVYVSYGNQEANLEETAGLDFHKLYGDAGAVALDREYVDVEVKGNKLRIGGIYGYCQVVRYAEETSRMDEADYLLDFQDTDAYKILMCHMPVCWVDSESLYDYDVDCVFSGHAHGGQVRLPLIGGLWAPDQGRFPGQECGVYETEEDQWVKYKADMLKWVEEQAEEAKKKAEEARKQAESKAGMGMSEDKGEVLEEQAGFDYASYYKSDIFDSYRPSYLVLSRGLGNTDRIPRFNNVPEIVVVDYRN